LRIPIVLDSFVSLYNTVVEDRKYISKTSVLASLVLSLEKLAFSTAKLVLVDTDAHSSYYQSQYKLPKKQLLVVPVGAQQVFFSSSSRHIADTTKAELRVLFYSTFIPLHGIATVVRAIELSADSFAEWTVVGSGQHFNLFDKLVKEKPGLKIKHLLWASTEELARLYTEHDVALGIFGNTDKAARVIPNKVYETIASGVPLITRKSPAIDELVKTETPGLWQIEANNAKALVDALEDVRRSKDLLDYPLYSSLRRQITPKAVAFHLEAGLKELFNKTHTVS
jgi:glycosyltransferase involved in cell wall biosynthesis